MYDLGLDFKKFYYNEVVLSKKETDTLREKKKLNIERLRSGLEEYNEENKTSYKLAETLEQGSVAMSTVTQNENKDYDIDVAIVFDETNIGELTPVKIKNIVVKALRSKCTNFKTPPEAKTNCVRIVYSDNYHIDFAIYKRIKNNDGSYKYEHAGSEWRPRDPRAINNWFKDEIKTHGEKLRQAVRLSKMFCKSREYWRMPGGLIQSVLMDEKVQNYTRIDEMFYYTIKEVQKRLAGSIEVDNPTDNTQSLLLTPSDDIKMNNLCSRLQDKIDKLSILFESDCTREKAAKAWNEFFQHSFWTEIQEQRDCDSLSESFSTNNQNNILVYDDTEDYIENLMPVNIQYSLSIDCKVSQKGFRPMFLKHILQEKKFLGKRKTLEFEIANSDFDFDRNNHHIYWKIKNEGAVAIDKNCIRGQVVKTNSQSHRETTDFIGRHFVECYVVKNGVCVARAQIEVPISNYEYCLG